MSTIITIDDYTLKDLYKYGVRGIEIGIENFSNNVLQRYRKGHNCQEAITALRKIRDSKIIPGIDFIMFDPWTSINELKHNLRIIEQEKIDVLTDPIVFNRLYPFLGTQFYDIVDMNQYFKILKWT